jgi:hypothetical protein
LSLLESYNQGNYEDDNEQCQRITIQLPQDADVLIGYSTTPGYLSWRHSNTGSWFIQTVCKVMTEDAWKEDIVSIMTQVYT